MKRIAAIATAISLAMPSLVGAENIVFPSGASFIDVTLPPYGAPRDGSGDAAPAINSALKDHIGTARSIYLPNGTYRIAGSLIFPDQPNGNLPAHLTLQGQSETGTVILLANDCDGFADPSSPRAMIVTGHDVAQCFGNNVRNLTINAGSGNPGAIGLRYYANNTGTAANLTITCNDGDGHIGLDLYWQNENGPLLVKNVSVVGFGIGVNAGSCQNSQTIEHLTLRNQRECGIRTTGGVLSIRDLVSVNAVPAVDNSGVMTIIGARCTGGSPAQATMSNSSTMYVRDFSASGYGRGIDNRAGTMKSLEGLSASEWASHDQTSLFAGGRGMLDLPVSETPQVVWDPVSQWQVVDHPGDATDATVAIQEAIDAGRTTVYFNSGHYRMNGKVHVRGNVRTLYGFGCYLNVQKGGGFVIEEGTSDTVVFENFSGGYADEFFVTHASSRTVAVKNVVNWGIRKNAGTGDLFLEDICANPWTWFEFHGGNVWARQINPEIDGTHIVNNGANLWILGMKTERGGTLIETRAGGRTELCGFFCYTTTDPAGRPMFLVDESEFTAVGAETSYGASYDAFVEETRGGATRTLSADNLPAGCGAGHILPFFVARNNSGTSTESLPYRRHEAGVLRVGGSTSYDCRGRFLRATDSGRRGLRGVPLSVERFGGQAMGLVLSHDGIAVTLR